MRRSGWAQSPQIPLLATLAAAPALLISPNVELTMYVIWRALEVRIAVETDERKVDSDLDFTRLSRFIIDSTAHRIEQTKYNELVEAGALLHRPVYSSLIYSTATAFLFYTVGFAFASARLRASSLCDLSDLVGWQLLIAYLLCSPPAQAVLEPQHIRKSYLRFLNAATDRTVDRMNRPLMGAFMSDPTRASGYPLQPVDLRHVSSRYIEQVHVWGL